jgi:hypothetical protein
MENYGAVSWSRLPLMPFSIHKRFYERDKRAMWYLGSVGMFQAENTLAYLLGGAEKLPDGTVVDKKSVRDIATGRARPLPEPTIHAQDAWHEAPLKAAASIAEIA